ncbi:hypothetical protein VYU27_010080, partial [Nannochloropsis oceanica]
MHGQKDDVATMTSTATTSSIGASGRKQERKSAWPMISVDDALTIVLQHTHAALPVQVPLQEALGCVLAEDIVAREPQPPFAAAIMDGYAIHSSDGAGIFPVVGRLTAGIDPDAHGLILARGTVCYITTGAKLPQGADAVVKIEETEDASPLSGGGGRRETAVRLLVSSPPGQWVRAPGSDMAVGEVILRRLTLLGPAEIGLLASVGRVQAVSVFPKPTIGVLSTGDELIEAGLEGGREEGLIRDSNRPTLLALFSELVGRDKVVDLGIV